MRVAKANQWTTKEEQVQHLALALMGPAAEILRGFDDTADKALDDLWGRLRHRFGTVDECQQAMRDFESRQQSLAEFEQVLRTLHREAWPDQSDEQRDPVLKRRFEEGVASAELRQYLRLHHRDLDFRQTTEKARIFTATMGETKAKKSVRFMSDVPTPAIHHMTVPTIDFTPVLCRLDDIEKKVAGTDKATSGGFQNRQEQAPPATPPPSPRSASQNDRIPTRGQTFFRGRARRRGSACWVCQRQGCYSWNHPPLENREPPTTPPPHDDRTSMRRTPSPRPGCYVCGTYGCHSDFHRGDARDVYVPPPFQPSQVQLPEPENEFRGPRPGERAPPVPPRPSAH